MCPPVVVETSSLTHLEVGHQKARRRMISVVVVSHRSSLSCIPSSGHGGNPGCTRRAQRKKATKSPVLSVFVAQSPVLPLVNTKW